MLAVWNYIQWESCIPMSCSALRLTSVFQFCSCISVSYTYTDTNGRCFTTTLEVWGNSSYRYSTKLIQGRFTFQSCSCWTKISSSLYFVLDPFHGRDGVNKPCNPWKSSISGGKFSPSVPCRSCKSLVTPGQTLSVVCLPQFSVDNIIWTERFPVLPLAEATIYMTESELNTMKLKNEVMNTVDTNNSNPWALQSSQTADLCQQNHP